MSPVKSFEQLKAFRVIDLEGNVIAPEYDNIPGELLNRIFECMIRVEEMDNHLLKSQRIGSISFYMPSYGELATTVGVGAALENHDLIFSQYREQGTLIWRGFSFMEVVNQCIGNHQDLGKGRQMPVHYGSQELNWVTVSSPLTTQVPQASGAGYGFRLEGADRVAVTYFGEGAASEGDFHAGMNFAITLKCQTLFLCRNNGYAISTPSDDQYRGDGIAGKGVGYGMMSFRCDGNDALAVYHTVKEARKYIIEHQEPALIEFMTYRIGDHSTSDHSVLYRSKEELQSWKSINNPITRLGLYLKKSGKRNFHETEDKALRAQFTEEIIMAEKQAKGEQFPSVTDLFTDVYDQLTPNLEEQQKELLEHIKKYPEYYKLNSFVQKNQ